MFGSTTRCRPRRFPAQMENQCRTSQPKVTQAGMVIWPPTERPTILPLFLLNGKIIDGSLRATQRSQLVHG
jgi:hypothetical protein